LVGAAAAAALGVDVPPPDDPSPDDGFDDPSPDDGLDEDDLSESPALVDSLFSLSFFGLP
jgi:hypothetical protein